MPLLEVQDLRVAFHTRNGVVRAVNGASFTLEKGETLGVVGESGSGKSVTSYALMGLVPQPPGRISGRAMFGGIDLLRASPRELAAVRGKRMAMIFQDPMTCLNPYQRVGDQIMEPLLIHEKITKADFYAMLDVDRAAPWKPGARGACPSRPRGWGPIRTSFPAACASA